MTEVYIPAFWLEASPETLKIKLSRTNWELDNHFFRGHEKDQAILRAEWLKKQIPIAQTRELLLGETND